MQTPKHDLNTVKAVCEQYLKGMKELVEFTAPSRSVNCVVEVFTCDVSKAAEICLKGILLLGKNDFSHRVVQWGDIADVYGLQNYENNDWYIKFVLTQEDERWILLNISFHRPEKDLKLVDGRVLPGTGGDK